MTAVAYIRRSSDRHGSSLSFEVQRKAVLNLAKRHGDPEPGLIVERGRSWAEARDGNFGTGRGGKRRAWKELRDRNGSGEVSALYAYVTRGRRRPRTERYSNASAAFCVISSAVSSKLGVRPRALPAAMTPWAMPSSELTQATIVLSRSGL